MDTTRSRLASRVLNMSDERLMQLARNVFARHTVFAEHIIGVASTALVESHRRCYPQRAEQLRSTIEEQLKTLIEGDNWKNGIYQPAPDWEIIYGGRLDATASPYQSLASWRREARLLYLFNPLYRGMIETFVCYVVGEEFTINVRHPSIEGTTQIANDTFENWAHREGSDFEERCEEIVRRACTDGECIVWERTGPLSTSAAPANESGPRTALLRFLEPEQMKEPPERIIRDKSGLDAEQIAERSFTEGVETAKNDPETVYAYWFRDPADESKWDRIDQDDIRHVKINCSRNAKRGIPLLLTVTDKIRDYDKWMTSRLVLNQIRSAIAMVIYRNESVPDDMAQAIGEESDGYSDSTGTDGRPLRVPQRIVDAGTVMHLHHDDKAEFLSPNIQSQDASADGMAILRLIAVALGLPDYMVTGDASSSSYSSQQVAEARGAKTLLSWQRRFYRHIALLVRDVIQVEAGQISKADVMALRISVRGPKVIARDPLDIAQEADILVDRQIMSKKTARARLSLNSDEEDRNISEEQTEPMDQGMPTRIPVARKARQEAEDEHE